MESAINLRLIKLAQGLKLDLFEHLNMSERDRFDSLINWLKVVPVSAQAGDAANWEKVFEKWWDTEGHKKSPFSRFSDKTIAWEICKEVFRALSPAPAPVDGLRLLLADDIANCVAHTNNAWSGGAPKEDILVTIRTVLNRRGIVDGSGQSPVDGKGA